MITKNNISIVIALFLYQFLNAQIPYFSIQFDYDTRLEVAMHNSVETDSFYLIPVKGAGTSTNMADTSFVLKINKYTGAVDYKKIAYYEGQSVRNVWQKNNTLIIQGSKYNGPHESLVDNDLYFSVVDDQSFEPLLLEYFGLPGRLDVFYRPILTSDGGIFSSGWSFNPSSSSARQSLVFFKCDSNLQQQFIRLIPPFSPVNNHYGASAIETPDKGFIVVGTRQVGNPPDRSNALIVKVDSLGNQVFWKEVISIGDTTELYLNSLAQQSNGTYIACGRRIFNPQVGPGWERSWLVGFDAEGNILWSKTFAENERSDGACIKPSLDGNFYVCGYERDFADTPQYLQYATISKVSPSGQVIWHRKYSIEPPGMHFDGFFNVLPTSDGGILCSGSTTGSNVNFQNAWVLKLDSLGCAYPDCNPGVGVQELPIGNKTPFVFAPNPTSGLFTIKAKDDLLIEAVRIYSMQGQEVYHFQNIKNKQLDVDLTEQGNGQYFCSVLINGVWHASPIVLIK